MTEVFVGASDSRELNCIQYYMSHSEMKTRFLNGITLCYVLFLVVSDFRVAQEPKIQERTFA